MADGELSTDSGTGWNGFQAQVGGEISPEGDDPFNLFHKSVDRSPSKLVQPHPKHFYEKAAVKKGVVVAGHSSKEVAPGTLKSIWKQAELEDHS